MAGIKSDRGVLAGQIVFVALVGIFVLAAGFEAARWIRNSEDAGSEEHARESMRQQIADARRANRGSIFISNEGIHGEVEMDEFIAAKDTFESSDHFNLFIDYSHNIDDFLKRIAGARGIRRISISKSGLTDSGLASIGSIPTLEELSLFKGDITNNGIVNLAALEKLTTLSICPLAGNAIEISTVLSLPKVRKLQLIDPDGGGWVFSQLGQLRQATTLDKLVLISDDLSTDDLEDLRKQLPSCVVERQARKDYGK